MRMISGPTVGRYALGAAALTAVGLLWPGTAAAQRRERATEVSIITAEGGGPDFDTRSVRRGFNLFASADAAHYGARATGDFGSSISNYGDCHGNILYNCQNTRVRNRRGGTTAPYFEVEWVEGAPPSQFVKIRQVAPSVANATGGGWTAGYNQSVLGRPRRFGPHDGTLGRMFAGATATTDGSCRDHQGFPNGTTLAGVTKSGLQLLPGSDCPDTWGSEGWKGAHPIDGPGWKQLFDDQGGGDNFAWDFWRVPEAYQRTDKPFMGTRIHTYGEGSDYSSDVLANYGRVVPGGSGGPLIQGYPLGLLIHFDMFNFAVPTVSGAYFVQTTIVNRSEDVWNAPIDYDSLYFGFSMGGLFTNQQHSAYADPSRGLVVYHESGVNPTGPCSQGFRNTFPGGCSTGNVSGYGSGVTAIIFLKSPIGDLRNKLFTRTVSGGACAVGVDPFCSPNHALRGDTITFMRQTFGDFGGGEAVTFGTGARAAFGLIAGMEENTLAGRAITDFNERTQWTLFRSEFWPSNKAHYNKWVPPGNWDYNHDGVLDTLVLDTCGQFGCVGIDSDTMPGGWINRRGNIGGLQSFGPFSLAAGDTTSFVYAHVGGKDSVEFWAQVNSVIDLYLNNYLAPEAPPPARVISTRTVAGTDQFGTANPTVTVTFTDDPDQWVDPFLLKVADDVDGAPAATPLGILRGLNPTLSAQLRTRANDNLDRIEVYKSCNAGTTFTADNDCDGDPATTISGQSDVFGWRTYAQLTRDNTTGLFPTSFNDANVDGGRSYLYVFVAKSRGATFLLTTCTDPPACTVTAADTVNFAPPIRNPLSSSTSDPNVVSVYVPASRPSGYQSARVAFTAQPRASDSVFIADLTDNVVSSSYRAIFGNQIIVERDSLISTGAAVRSVVTIRRRENVDVSGVPTPTVIKTESFTYTSPEVFLVSGAGAAAAPATIGDTVRTATTYAGLGFLLTGSNGPVFGSITLTATGTTPSALLGRAEYPGFTLRVNNALATNATLASTYFGGFEAQMRGATSISELNLLPTDTLVPRGVVNSYMVQFREGSSTRTADGRGIYEVTWADDPFGVGRGFVLNLNNPAATEAEVQATLAARALPTTGLTDAETAALLAVDQSDLIPVQVPFTVRNVTYDRPVAVAMVRRVSSRIVLGNATDTLSVAVQDDQWVPGDGLFFIEDVVEDSVTPAGLVLDGSGQPVQRTRRAMTFSRAVLGCDQVRESCNPVVQQTAGATGYNPMRDGDRTLFQYYAGLSAASEYAFDVVAPVTGDQITALTDSALALIQVVPNPFVIFSQYQTSIGQSRVLFTNVPPRGTIRVYTVAGQLVQQIRWEPSDVQGDGDLFWDLRSREGIDIASGLYLWVLTAPSNPSDPNSSPIRARGKFVVIRGDAR
jgi:hypothetical protein